MALNPGQIDIVEKFNQLYDDIFLFLYQKEAPSYPSSDSKIHERALAIASLIYQQEYLDSATAQVCTSDPELRKNIKEFEGEPVMDMTGELQRILASKGVKK